MALTEISAGGFSRRGLAAFAGRDGNRTVGLVRLPVRAGEFLRLRSRSLTLRSPSTARPARRSTCVASMITSIATPLTTARMTRSVGTLALVDDGVDSTLVPSGCRATG